ncbi:MAG: DNA alkylation repair protein [Limisphaerales bacterium]
MKKTEVIALLKANRNERGISNWKRMGLDAGGLKSYGIGLSTLRKLAKQIGRDHKLAQQLWKSDNHDVKIVGLLIDEPKKMTREQAEAQVEEVGSGLLSHVFSSCDATLPKTDFAFDLAKDWIDSKDAQRRSCAWGLIYDLSKNNRRPELTEKFFLDCIKRIRADFDTEIEDVRLSMGGALIGIGKRTKKLNQAAVKYARKISPIEYDAGDTNCQPLDIMKHLTSDYLKQKLDL